MAFVELYMDSSGSNLNAGSTAATTAVYTSTGGNFDGTSVFTPTDGSTPASSVAAGDYVSLYNTGDTISRCVAKVVSVAAGVNGAVTVDTTIKYGTVPTVNSGSRALKAGGAWADLGITAATGAMNTGTAPQATRINVKAGTYANTTTARTLGLAATTAFPIWWRGYKTAIGDQETNYLAVAVTDIPSFTWTTGNCTVTGINQILSNIDFTGNSTSTALVNVSANFTTIYGCRFRIGATGSVHCLQLSGAGLAFFRNYVNCAVSTQKCVNIGAGGAQAYMGNYFTGGNGGLAGTTSIAQYVVGNVFDAIGGDAIGFTTAYGLFAGNSIYAPTGHGLTWSGTPQSNVNVFNNHFENVNQASKAAVNNGSGTASNLFRLVGNSYYNNTADVSGQVDIPRFLSAGTLAGSGFTNAAGQDFTPSALLRGIGQPGGFENIATFRGWMTPGALQAAAGGGINYLVGGGLVG